MNTIDKAYQFLTDVMKRDTDDDLYITVDAPNSYYSLHVNEVYLDETEVAWGETGSRHVTIDTDEDIVEIKKEEEL